MWYRKDADQGHPDALYNLAAIYEEGEAVPQDYVQALTWYTLAAEAYPKSQRKCREAAINSGKAIATKMTAKQIEEAQRRRQKWRPTS
jgi:hypothetical protein